MSLNMQTERLRALPDRADDTWQGGVIRLDTRVREPDGTLAIPEACLWVSRLLGKVHVGAGGTMGSVTPAAVVATMVEFATDPKLAHARPGRVEVTDRAQAAALAEVLGPLGVAVVTVEEVQAVRALERELSEQMAAAGELIEGTDAPPPPLEADPAVTPALLATLAGAAVAFHKAEPWRLVEPTEVLQVVSPKVEKALRFVHVMGGGGEQFGLAFFPSKAAFRKMFTAENPTAQAMRMPMVSVALDGLDGGVPEEDVAAWKRLKLPVAKRGRTAVYPFPVRFDRGVWTRPTATEIATMAGLLRAVAMVTAEQLDAGLPITVPVTTAAGTETYTFKRTAVVDPQAGDEDAVFAPRMVTPAQALSAVVASMSEDAFAPLPAAATPARRTAVQRLQAALKADGPKRRGLAMEAAAADPTLADAHVLAGIGAKSPARAADAFRRAMEVAGPADDNARVRATFCLAMTEAALGHADVANTLVQRVVDQMQTHPVAARLIGVGGT